MNKKLNKVNSRLLKLCIIIKKEITMQADLDRVINWLLDYRKENPTFIFKGRTSPIRNLEESFWLNGNENYFYVKFSNRGTPNTFTTISYRFWFRNRDKNLMSDYDFFICYNNELSLKKDDWNYLVGKQKTRLLDCIDYLNENLDQFGLIPSEDYNAATWGGKSYRFRLSEENKRESISNQAINKLEYFVKTIKPNLDPILSKNLTNQSLKNELFISNTEFRKYLNLLNQYRPGTKKQAGMI